MNDIDQKLRKLCLQADFKAHISRPYALDTHLEVDSGGVHVQAWSSREGDVSAIVRQAVLRTLEENGIPNTVVEIDALVMTMGTDVYENSNPRSPYPVGKWLAGCWQVYSFRFTQEAEGWFEVAVDDDESPEATTGEIRTRLRLV